MILTKAVAKADNGGQTGRLVTQMQAMAPQFRAALPRHVSEEKFARVALTAINSNPDLQEADTRSLFGALVKCAQDGLLPDNREAALVIFNKKRGSEWVKHVQAMPMIGGLLKMMRQSGEVAWVDAHLVRANDKFQYRPGLDEQPIFEPNWFGDRGEVIGVFAHAKLKSGEVVPPEIMTIDEIRKVQEASRSGSSGPWKDWWEQMALKTVLRRYLKKLPTSTDVMEAMERDETMMVRDVSPLPVQLEGEATAVEQPQKVSAVKRLISSNPEPAPEPEQAPEPSQEAVEAWKERIDGCTTIVDLNALRAEYEAFIDGAEVNAEIEGAFRDMGAALKRKK